MQRAVEFVEGEYYHLYNRGVDKRVIFSSTVDYERFMMLLYLANSTENVRIGNVLKSHTYKEVFDIKRCDPIVAIGAFCLMPNHFHILATPLVENGLSTFMLKLQTGYSMYFNTKNYRNGSLFQGPFKSEHAGHDTYLKYLFSYIHLNPAKIIDPYWKERVNRKKSLMKFVESYPYSSLEEYLLGTHSITSPGAFPDYFFSKAEVRAHIADWLDMDQK